jgi:hypothetical protein
MTESERESPMAVGRSEPDFEEPSGEVPNDTPDSGKTREDMVDVCCSKYRDDGSRNEGISEWWWLAAKSRPWVTFSSTST